MAKKQKSTGKLPYMQLYPSDWQAEMNLKFCSWEARYLWFEMMLLMHQAEPRGFLIRNGAPYTETDLCNVIHSATPQRLRDCLFELETNHVFSRDRRGVIYSRKMVKHERKKTTAQQNGKRGGNPELKKDKSEINRSKNGDKVDLGLPISQGNEKEISALDNQTLVRPESRDQSPESKKKERKTLSPDPGGSVASVSLPEIQIAFSMFNELASRIGLPVAQKINPPRIAKMKKRLLECGGIDGWGGALQKLERSDFCSGRINGFKASIDFLLQESSFTKLLEGNYDNHAKGKNHASTIRDQARELMDSFRED